MLKNGRIPSLDGFRAIAVLLVIFWHLVIRSSLPLDEKKILELFAFGEVGVRIFFIISGFLITYLLLKEKERAGEISLKLFYIRRSLRIFPVFYFYLFIVSILNPVLNLQIPFLVFLSGGLYLQNFEFWGSNWFIDHSWSLAVEEQFYILWPFIFLRISNFKKISACISALAIGSLMRAFHYKYPGESNYLLAPFFMHADFLFMGCFMAYFAFYNQEQLVNFINRAKPIFVYISILAIWIFSKFEYHPTYDKIFIPTSGAVINVSICFLLLYFIFKEKSIGYKFLNFPLITFIGQLSYSLYVWQQLFISDTGYWFSEFPQNIMLTFLVAYCSYQIIEKPFLRLKGRFKPAVVT